MESGKEKVIRYFIDHIKKGSPLKMLCYIIFNDETGVWVEIKHWYQTNYVRHNIVLKMFIEHSYEPIQVGMNINWSIAVDKILKCMNDYSNRCARLILITNIGIIQFFFCSKFKKRIFANAALMSERRKIKIHYKNSL